MPKVFAITGTPGTGKTTLARSLKRRLKNVELISANDVAVSQHLYSGKDPDGAKLVDTRRLEKWLNKRVSASKRSTVILDGHLLCEMKIAEPWRLCCAPISNRCRRG